jgi:predicted nucleic acid-binding protein
VIYVDTSFLYPLFNVEDDDHARVREVFESYRGRRLAELLVTIPQVIFETITLIRMTQRQGRPDTETRHRQAVHAGERLLSGRLARVHRPSEEDERAAFDYFKRHRDQEYSMVDCLSFVVMDKLEITEALAVDSDFTHRFAARPGPRRE